MSEELTMAQKVEMLREARGLGGLPVSKAGKAARNEARDAVRAELAKNPGKPYFYTETTTRRKANLKESEPFEDNRPGGDGGGSSPLVGAFYGLYTDEDGDTYLQGGTVTGGNGGSDTRADIKVIDADTGPVETAGTVLYLHANCKATVEDGIMLPGCELLSTGVNTTPGVNHTFTVAADTGYLHQEIGRWTETAFLPAGSGNFLASGCIGNFALTRV
jgi:hypothetical protein